MRIFVAGGTGVIGRRLVPQLVARGHEVIATVTDPSKRGIVERLGAQPVVMDGQLIRKRQFPLVGAGTGYSSFVHVDDAARATWRTIYQP